MKNIYKLQENELTKALPLTTSTETVKTGEKFFKWQSTMAVCCELSNGTTETLEVFGKGKTKEKSIHDMYTTILYKLGA